MPQALPFAIYARISNRYDEKTDSLSTQRDSSLKFAASRSLPVNPDWIFQERDSGYETGDERVDLLRVRELARLGKIGGVIFHDTDRLSREPIELCSLVQEFRRNEAEVHFVLTPTEDTVTGKAMLFLRGVGHEMEWLAIKERTTRIKDAIVASGRFVGEGGARFGYSWDKATRTRVADPVSSEYVRLIFRMVGEEGMSMRQVAIELNRRNIPTPSVYKGKTWKDGRVPLWCNGNVREIVVDEVYKGVATARRVKRLRKRVFVYLPRDQWVTLSDGRTEALVDDDQWEAANRTIRCNDIIGQRTKRARTADTRNEKEFALFRGIISCGACGAPLRVARARNWNKATRKHDGGAGHKIVYRCDSRRWAEERGQDDRCYGKPVYEEKVRDAAWALLVQVVSDEGLVEAEIARLKADRPGEDVFRESLEAAVAEAATCERRSRNLVVSMAEEDDAEIRRMLRDQVEALKDEKAGHEARAASLAERLAAYDRIEARAVELRSRSAEIRSGLADAETLTWEERRHFMDWLSASFVGNGTKLVMQLDLGLEASVGDPLSEAMTPTRSIYNNRQRAALHFHPELARLNG
jgi:DNA invertase Pin-like site-specific DNA recombinase